MEKQLIQWLKREFEPSINLKSSARSDSVPGVKLGIGDDCAVLPPFDRDLVVTCDAILDGVHFVSSEHSMALIGRKALAVNLSDLASMAAAPYAAVVSLNLPQETTFELVKELYEGMRELAEQHGIEIVGGDTNVWGGPLSISVTAFGLAPDSGAWTIDGAKPGDRILVTGPLGGSLAGRHLRFQPRNELVNRIEDKTLIHACTDISDSLSVDLVKIANASLVGFEIQANLIPVASGALELAARSSQSPLEHALTDGEDFELIFALAEENVPKLLEQSGPHELFDIGFFTEPDEFRLIQENGEPVALKPKGYEHGSS